MANILRTLVKVSDQFPAGMKAAYEDVGFAGICEVAYDEAQSTAEDYLSNKVYGFLSYEDARENATSGAIVGEVSPLKLIEEVNDWNDSLIREMKRSLHILRMRRRNMDLHPLGTSSRLWKKERKLKDSATIRDCTGCGMPSEPWTTFLPMVIIEA